MMVTTLTEVIFTAAGRKLIAEKRNLVPIGGGFLDPESGAAVTDPEMLEILFEGPHFAAKEQAVLNDETEVLLLELIDKVLKDGPLIDASQMIGLVRKLKIKRESVGRKIPAR